MNVELSLKESGHSQVSELQDLAHAAKEYASLARAKNTNKAYASDWKDFDYWCRSMRLTALPANPQTVIAYLIGRAKNEWVNQKGAIQKPLKIASLQRRLTTISQAHRLANQPFDKGQAEIQEVWKGMRNRLGAPQNCKEPILLEDLRKMIAAIPLEKQAKLYLIGYRDRALLLLGFVGAFRRSEIVALNKQDIKFAKEGLIVHLRKSKTDQEGEGRRIALPYGSNILTCPVRTLQDWLEISGIDKGPLFRYIDKGGAIKENALTSHAVALIIKRNAHLIDRKELFSGHSLRAGFATTAAIAGVPEHVIMKQTGHKKSDTIKRYIRLGNMWTENAATKIGL